jgi:hypothetical protein
MIVRSIKRSQSLKAREDVMLRWKLLKASLVAAVVSFAASYGYAAEFSARLNGFNELGALNNQTGAVLSDGTGTVSLRLNAGTIDYELTYSNVGTTPPKTGTVSQAHIHFGKSRDSGGVLVFFCTNLTFSGTGPTPPACPKNSGTVSGTWTKTNVQAIAGQNVAAGDFDGLVDALASNTAYANVHTTSGTTPDTAFPAGEIRGQIHEGDLDKKHDHHESHDNHEH